MLDRAGFLAAVRNGDPVHLGARVVTIVLLILTADALARLSWRLFIPATDFSLPATVALSGRSELDVIGQFDIERIRKAHLFGSSTDIRAVPAQHINAPQTKLDLVLRGIMFAQNRESSRAILSTRKGPHRTYPLGAHVPGGATLEAMYADRVLLRRGGALETLFLSETRRSGAETAPATATAPRGAPRFTVDSRNNVGIQRTLAQLRREVLLDPAGLHRRLRIQPVGTGAEFQGFRIFPGPQGGALMNQLGLQAGDTVTRVNDVFLDEPIHGMRALQDLADAREVSIGVMRQGNLVELRYKFGE